MPDRPGPPAYHRGMRPTILAAAAAALTLACTGCAITPPGSAPSGPASGPTSAAAPAQTGAATAAAPLVLQELPPFKEAERSTVSCTGDDFTVMATTLPGEIPSPMVVAGPQESSGAIVFAHQSNGDECQWLPAARGYAEQGYRVYLPRAAGKTGPSALAAAVAAARDAGALKVAVVGASMGGTYAIGAASAMPAQPEAVVAVSAPADFGDVDAAGLIGSVSSPLLLTVGSKDNDFAAALPKLAAAAPSAQTVVQDGTSAHGVALIAEGGAAAHAVQQFVSDMIPLG